MPLIDDIVLEFDVIQAKYYDILPCNNAKIPYQLLLLLRLHNLGKSSITNGPYIHSCSAAAT